MDGKAVIIEALNSESKKQTWIIMKFPHGMDLNCLTSYPQVHAAARCIMRDRELGRTIETRQVKITASGAFPNNEIDLGWYGKYYIRPFTPEPMRCFRCQGFGHHQRTCIRPFICAVCAGRHQTEECIKKKKEQDIKAEFRCPNCRNQHPAWSMSCPARKEEIREKIEQQ